MVGSSILLLFWHGLGDVIMATPAFHELVTRYPDCRFGIAVKKLVFDSEILSNCPYFDKIYEIPSVWESKNYQQGLKNCLLKGKKIQKENGYEQLICIEQRPGWRYGIHKIHRTANELGLGPLKTTQTEVYISHHDYCEASQWLKENDFQENHYIFLHRKTGYPLKDMPGEAAEKIIRQLPALPVIEVGKTYSINNRSISFSFALVEKARYIIVVDSVFMHAADALGKDITMAYFAIRPGIVDEVRPLNVKCRCMESYSCTYPFLRKLYWYGQKAIYRSFFKNSGNRGEMFTKLN